MNANLLTTREAATVLKCTPDHVGLLLRRGSVRGIKRGRDWLIDLQEIEKYLAIRPKRGRKSITDG